MNKLRVLRKENNKMAKKLDQINKPVYLDISVYLLSSRLYIEKIEEIKQDILYIMLEAQEQHVSFDEKIGESVKAFCDDVIKSSVKKTIFESVLEFTRILAMYGFTFTFTILIFAPDILDKMQLFFTNQNVILQLSLSSTIWSLGYVFAIYFINVYLIKFLLLFIHDHRYTRVIMAGFAGFISIFISIIAFTQFDQDALLFFPMINVIIALFVSVSILLATSLWIIALRKKHIELTMIQQ